MTVFVLLVYWVFGQQLACRVQMERWDGAVLDIISTCADPGQKSLQLLRMHALTGYQTTSYPYVIGKLNALKTMVAGDFSDLHDMLGEEGVTQTDLMKVAITVFIAMCSATGNLYRVSTLRNLCPKEEKPENHVSACLQHLPICYST